MNAPRLLTLHEAAEQINVPVAALRSVADAHRYTIRMGRALRLHPDDLEGLIEKCRCHPRGQDSHSENEQADRPSGSLKTQASKVAQAQGIATKLKSSSQNTSPAKTAPVVRLRREK